MIFVILAICIALIVVGKILADRSCSDMGEMVGIGMFVTGGFGVLAGIIAAIVLGVGVANLSTIDDRIAMYEEENTRIEAQIADVVSEYQKYETDIIMEVKPESAVTMVSLYPELKADALVESQIQVYVSNNETIKELKDEKLQGRVQRWWLYFGK